MNIARMFIWALVITWTTIPAFAQKQQIYSMPSHLDKDRVNKIIKLLPLIDSLYVEYARSRNYPSIVYGVLLDGLLIGKGHYGYINLEKQIPASAEGLYRIASMSKSVTALSILQLRDAGKLRLDDPAYLYIPELKQNKLLTTDAAPITIRHLMTHGAGFPEDNPWGDRQLADSRADLIQLIKSGTYFSNVPGITYEYSNLGFALLGEIVEKVSGLPLDRYTKEKIFKPLGMMSTTWEYATIAPDRLAHGYRYLNGQYEDQPLLHHGSYGAMGGLITSINDFAKYVALHQSAWPPRSGPENAVLKRSSLREMHLPANISGFNPTYTFPDKNTPCGIITAYNYGLNWLKDCEQKVYVGHSGGLPGFGSQWRIMPEYGLGIIAFANHTYAGIGSINLKILDTLVHAAGLQPYSIPASDLLNQRKNQLMEILPDWDEHKLKLLTSGSGKIFAENFLPDYPLENLRKQTQSTFKSLGTQITVGDLRPENQLRGSFELKGDLGKANVFFTLTPENPPLIQELRITPVRN